MTAEERIAILEAEVADLRAYVERLHRQALMIRTLEEAQMHLAHAGYPVNPPPPARQSVNPHLRVVQ